MVQLRVKLVAPKLSTFASASVVVGPVPAITTFPVTVLSFASDGFRLSMFSNQVSPSFVPSEPPKESSPSGTLASAVADPIDAKRTAPGRREVVVALVPVDVFWVSVPTSTLPAVFNAR